MCIYMDMYVYFNEHWLQGGGKSMRYITWKQCWNGAAEYSALNYHTASFPCMLPVSPAAGITTLIRLGNAPKAHSLRTIQLSVTAAASAHVYWLIYELDAMKTMQATGMRCWSGFHYNQQHTLHMCVYEDGPINTKAYSRKRKSSEYGDYIVFI